MNANIEAGSAQLQAASMIVPKESISQERSKTQASSDSIESS